MIEAQIQLKSSVEFLMPDLSILGSFNILVTKKR